MSDETRLTDERLRMWHLSQGARERLCMGILALDPNYSDIRPRRPQGGPDGAHDIEAHFRGTLTAWGAVGFVDRAVDSREDKRQIGKKFRDDLAAALKANPDLKHFVFFTNIDLTPAQRGELVEHARGQGVTSGDIFYRERLRLILDHHPAGLALRFKFLEIKMSDEEQIAFLDAMANDVLKAIETQGERILATLEDVESNQNVGFRRLDFQAARAHPTRRVDAAAILEQELSPGELGQFAMVVALTSGPYPPGAVPRLCMSTSSEYIPDLVGLDLERVPPEEVPILYASRQVAWEPPAAASASLVDRQGLDRAPATSIVRSSIILEADAKLESFPNLESFAVAHARIFATGTIWQRLAGFVVAVNGFTIIVAMKTHLCALQHGGSDGESDVASVGLPIGWLPEVAGLFATKGCFELGCQGLPFDVDPVHGGMRTNFEAFVPSVIPPGMFQDTMTVL
jgi:hypothetical protein